MPAAPHLADGARTTTSTASAGATRSTRARSSATCRGPDKLAGFYMGPDGYIWGREFISTEPETPRELVIKKQWYSFMLWGRLSYDPDLPDSAVRADHRGALPRSGRRQAAPRPGPRRRKVFPQITRFFWGDIDLHWFPEACLSHPRAPRASTRCSTSSKGRRCRAAACSTSSSGARTSWRRSRWMASPHWRWPTRWQGTRRRHSAVVAELRRSQGKNKELRLTLGDLEAMAHLGNYYAAKIRGATDLALFDKTAKAGTARIGGAQPATRTRSLEAVRLPPTRFSTSSRSCTTAWAGWTFPGSRRKWNRISPSLACGRPARFRTRPGFAMTTGRSANSGLRRKCALDR